MNQPVEPPATHRALLDRLRAAIEAHNEALEGASASWREHAGEAEARFTTVRDAAVAERDRLIHDADELAGEAIEGAERFAEEQELSLLAERDDLLQRLAERGESALDTLEQSSSDAAWLAETMAETATERARSAERQAETNYKKTIERIDAIAALAERRRAGAGLVGRSALAAPDATDDSEKPAPLGEILPPLEQSVARIGRAPSEILGRRLAIVMLIALGGGGGAVVALAAPSIGTMQALAGGGAGAGLILGLLIRLLGKRRSRIRFSAIASDVGRARRSARIARDSITRRAKSVVEHAGQRAASEAEEATESSLSRSERVKLEVEKRRTAIEQLAEKKLRESREQRDTTIESAQRRRSKERDDAERSCETKVVEARDEFDRLTVDARASRQATLSAAADSFEREHTAWKSDLASLASLSERADPARESDDPAGRLVAPLGQLRIATPRLARFRDPVGEHEDLPAARPLADSFDLPLTLVPPGLGSLLVRFDGATREEAIALLQRAMLGALATAPPGGVRFTIADPIGLGQSFAGFMHLADYDDALVSGRIWTEPQRIDQQLAMLTERMELIIQTYLRNQYETIEDYNRAAGEIPEPTRFLVLNDCPHRLSDQAITRLGAILASGPRCGVHTLIALDNRRRPPKTLGDLLPTPSAVEIDLTRQRVTVDRLEPEFATYEPPSAPSDDLVTRVAHEAGRAALDAGRIEVGFGLVSPPAPWTRSTKDELRVPIGKVGATGVLEFHLGVGTNQHALIAGKTGSGKSTLLHVLVTSAALWHSPDELEFYLVDFKKGVEFKRYAERSLAHARVVAIESDREFGLSVLQHLDAEIERRGEMFRQANVPDLAAYRDARPGEVLPRALLVIDEFHELFVVDDRVAQDAAGILDRLVRQGRAFGVHVVLGSQSLGGAFAMARSTLGQMAVRIALPCSEADAYQILDETNDAARRLRRPGEAIYNDAAGAIDANTPFQVVWLPKPRHDEVLEALAERPLDRAAPDQVVFEGGAAPALHDDAAFVGSSGDAATAGAWIGTPVAVAPPQVVRFEARPGQHLLMVGASSEQAGGALASAVLSLNAGRTPGDARFVIIDPGKITPETREVLREAERRLPNDTRVYGPDALEQCAAELREEIERRRSDGSGGPSIYLVLAGLHALDAVRIDDSAFGLSFGEDVDPGGGSLARDLETIFDDGPTRGVHYLVWSASRADIERALGRRGVERFDHRLVWEVGSSDSAALLDTPAASRLTAGRALYLGAGASQPIKLRPYAPPTNETIDALLANTRSPADTGG